MTETAATPSTRISILHLALLTPWVAYVAHSYDRIIDNSFLWHVRAGDLQIMATEVLTADPFSLTLRGETWITQSWLAELFYGWAEPLTGLAFTAPMLVLMGLLTVAGVGLAAYSRGAGLLGTATVVVLTAILLPRFLVPRPVLFSYPLLVLVILAWERRSTRWTLPFLFWVWASIHASFAIGLVYLTLAAIWRKDSKAWRVVLVSGLMTLFTAHGLGIVRMLLDFARSRQYLDLVSEWRTPDFLTAALAPVLVGIVLLLYGAAKGRLETRSLWVIAPFLALAFSAERAVATAWIAIAPLVATSFAGVTVKRFRGFPIPSTSVLVLGILVLPLFLTNPVEIDSEAFPVAAAGELEDSPTFHDSYVGGYLIWASHPQVGVFIDDRVELYRERVRESVDMRSGAVSWQEVFARDGIRQAVLATSDPLLDDLLAAGWAIRYRDDNYSVLVPQD